MTFYNLQGRNTLVCEQRRELWSLGKVIKDRCNICGPLTNDKKLEFTTKLIDDPDFGYFDGEYLVTTDDIVRAIDEVGGYVLTEMNNLKN